MAHIIWVIQFYIKQYNFSICHIELCVGRIDLCIGRIDLFSGDSTYLYSGESTFGRLDSLPFRVQLELLVLYIVIVIVILI